MSMRSRMSGMPGGLPADLAALAALGGMRNREDEVKASEYNTPEALAAALASYNEQHEFKPGDLVMNKPGIGAYKFMDGDKGERGIVLAKIDPPIVNDNIEAMGHISFLERADVRVGIILPTEGGAQKLHIWAMDSARLSPSK